MAEKRPRQRRDGLSLVPPHIVDHASQRLFVVSLFVLVQCWKVYDVILIRTELVAPAASLTLLNNFTFVLKYAAIDGIFLWLLPVLAIPKVSFSPFITLLLTLALNAATFVLASNATAPLFANLMLPFWKVLFNKKELTLVGDAVSSQNVVDMNAHFKGRYTIQYLPDSLAHFNPFQYVNECLSGLAPLQLPIEFNTTTDLGFLLIQHISPSKEVKYINYTRFELTRLAKRDYSHLKRQPKFVSHDLRVFYIEVPLIAPGRYKIAKVTDHKGVNIRSFKSELLIAHCPSAKLVYPAATDTYSTFQCISRGNKLEASNLHLPLAQVSGVTPLTLEFAIRLNGNKIGNFNSTIQTGLENKNDKDSITWYQSETVSRNILEREILRNPAILSKAHPGKLEFQLLSVSDYFGKSKRYNPLSRDKDVWYEVELRQKPVLALFDKDIDLPLLVNSTKRLFIDTLQDLAESEFPITINFAFNHASNDLLSRNFSKTFKTVPDLKRGIEVPQPGKYYILKGVGPSCPCEVNTSKKVYVELVPVPRAEIKGEPLLDKCVGMVGYKFDFDLTGKPPFHIQYQVFKNVTGDVLKPVLNERGLSVRTLKTFDLQQQFEYRPPGEGNYLIVFKGLKDLNYHAHNVPLDEKKHTYLTYFKQRSRVSFFDKVGSFEKTIALCRNSSTSIPVYFSGNHPFSFTYDIINTQTGQEVVTGTKLENLLNDVFTIRTPTFTNGGEFKVVLRDVIDNLGCDADIDSREIVRIKARGDVPEILFEGDESVKHVQIVEGDSITIPLQIKSSIGRTSSDKVEYEVKSLQDPTVVKKRAVQNSRSFTVTEEGIYTLSSFSNGGCVGTVLQKDRQYIVTFHPKPKLLLTAVPNIVLKQDLDTEINAMHLRPVCQNEALEVKLHLEGTKPFVVSYEVKLPSGKVESRVMNVKDNEVQLNLPTNEGGLYEHRFKAVYDKLYTPAKLQGMESAAMPIVKYGVRSLPNIQFSGSDHFVQVCVTSLQQKFNPIPEIPVTFEGDYPFTVKASLKYENGKTERLVLKDIKEPYLNIADAVDEKGNKLQLLDRLVVGEHLLTVDEISNGHGCVRKTLSKYHTYVIAITDVPNITKLLKKLHYCVGDHIGYNLSGISPFNVYYEFNGKVQKAELAHMFHRLASKPGELSILALLDSSVNQCLVNFTHEAEKFDNLKLKIYDLPSVEISQGDDIIRDIHEGDLTEITFSFTGVPPFNLTYVRTLESGDSKQRHKKKNQKGKPAVIETKTVENIWEHEYTVAVGLEGTYEAIEVHDAFCVAKRDESSP